MPRSGRIDFTGYLFITTGVALLALWGGSEWMLAFSVLWAAMVVIGLFLFGWRGLLLLVGAPAALWRPLWTMQLLSIGPGWF